MKRRSPRALLGLLAAVAAVGCLLPHGWAVVRVALGLGLAGGALGAALGWACALLAYAAGHPFDRMASRFFEIILSLPFLVLSALLAQAASPGRFLLALALLRAAQGGHRLLGEAQALEVEPFIEAARALGARRWWIFARHMGASLLPATVRFAVEGAALAAPLDLLLSFVGAGSGLLVAPVREAIARGQASPLAAPCLLAAALGASMTALAEASSPRAERHSGGLPG